MTDSLYWGLVMVALLTIGLGLAWLLDGVVAWLADVVTGGRR